MTILRRLTHYLIAPLAAVLSAVIIPTLAILALLYIAIWWILLGCGVLLLIVFFPWPVEGQSMGNRKSGRGKQITISGGDFTFRTFHAPGQQNGRDLAAEATLDKLHTVTMPAIDGAEHFVVPTRRIRL